MNTVPCTKCDCDPACPDCFGMGEILIPDWACDISDGTYRQLGAQLCTRDGRRVGNAFVVGIHSNELSPGDEPMTTIRTDMGNEVVMNTSELMGCFYPPKWIKPL